MTFQKGDHIIVKLNGTFHVAEVQKKTRLKRGLVYEVLLENGTMVERASINKELSHCHIHKGLTKNLQNKKDGQESAT